MLLNKQVSEATYEYIALLLSFKTKNYLYYGLNDSKSIIAINSPKLGDILRKIVFANII